MKISFKVLCVLIIVIESSTALGDYYNRPTCPPLKLKNGRVRSRQRGRFSKFMCNPGYLLAGERYSTCMFGKWETPVPKCVRNTCSKVRSPANGLIYPSHNDAVLHFFCKTGFKLLGANITYCDGNQWDASSPTCLQTNSTPSYNCSFETDDLCGWTHDLNHDFDWTRENFETPSGMSIGTGPKFDHTLGKGKGGYYMYIESSSRNRNDVARLISPLYDKTTNDTCFEFYYHMFGSTTGTLNVYLKKFTENWNLTTKAAKFSKGGNQGDVWFKSVLFLGTIDEDYQIIIEGVRGSGYSSDIAIDDVRIINNCVLYNELSTTLDYESTTELPVTFLEIESCEGRCGASNNISESNTQILCDCDDACLENKKCCPDYLDICVLATMDLSTTTDMSNDVNEPQIDVLTTETNTAINTTLKISTTSAVISTIPITNTTPTIRTTPTIPTTTFSPTTIKRPVLLPVPTTLAIKRKVLTTTTTTTPKITTPKVTATPKIIVTKKPKNPQDWFNVPRKPEVFEDNTPFSTEDKDNFVDKQSEIEINKPFLTKWDKSQHLKIASEKVKVSLLTISITVVGSLIALSVIILSIFIVVKTKCKKLRRMNASNGDSQSDVRFLTRDEELDFNLHRDYDDL